MNKFIKIALTSEAEDKEYPIQRFEELMGIRYLPHLECINWKIEQWVRKKCRAADKKGKIGDLAKWLGMLHGKALEEATIPSIAIRWIHEKIGYGVFTTQPIHQWGFIGEYTGILRERPWLFPDINDYCFMYPRAWFPTKVLTIDGEKAGNFTRFINHSDTPNLESVGVYHNGLYHIIFRTLQAIPANTELTYDYGDLYWRQRKKLYEDEINPQ